MQEFLVRTSHRLKPLPSGRWAMTQRWNDLLFAHWPVPASSIAPLLPNGLQVDTFQGSAWVGIAPFWVDRIKIRDLLSIPGVSSAPELNMRTFVREERTRTQGVCSLSLDSRSLLAVIVGSVFNNLPYHWAEMRLEQKSDREFSFYSRRRFAGRPVLFKACYRGLGPTQRLIECRSGTLEYFLMERNYLYSSNRAGDLLRAPLHHVSWPLEKAEAVIERNDLAAAVGIVLPQQAPVLHYMRRMAVYVWPAERVRLAVATRPVTISVTPSG